jgi:hypothetical protein
MNFSLSRWAVGGLAACLALLAGIAIGLSDTSRNVVLQPSDILEDDSGWKTWSFSGESLYEPVSVDGMQAVRAKSEGTASLMYRETPVDLAETPYMVWTWRVDERPEGHDERSKSGDDYPVRLYAVKSNGWGRLGLESINYVWSHSAGSDERWPNPYTDDSKVVVVASSSAKIGTWRREVRNVREDFAREFGEEISQLDGIALMADTDDTGGRSCAFIGEIYFTDTPPGQ